MKVGKNCCSRNLKQKTEKKGGDGDGEDFKQNKEENKSY